MDSLLVVCCYESIDKNVFYTYDKDTGELLKTFGTIGNGPGEMMDLMTIYADREKHELYHNSFNVPKYVKFNVDSFINGNNGITYYKIRENKIPAFLHRYSDSLFISGANGKKGYEYRFALVDYKGDTTYCLRDYTNKNTKPFLNPSRTRFFTWNNGKLETEIYKVSENSIERLYLREYVKEDEHIDEKNHPGITSYVCTTDDYIFCGWSQNVKKRTDPMIYWCLTGRA